MQHGSAVSGASVKSPKRLDEVSHDLPHCAVLRTDTAKSIRVS